jgi:hypothetical protein
MLSSTPWKIFGRLVLEELSFQHSPDLFSLAVSISFRHSITRGLITEIDGKRI